MKPIKPLYVVIIAIVVAAAGFYGGVLYQKNQTHTSFAQVAGGQFGGRRFGGGSGMTPVGGQIVSSGDNTITVKMPDGSSKIVNVTSQTIINKSTKGSQSDLTTGERVTAFGMTNSDGSVTAQAINIGNGMFRMGRPAPSGSQQ